MTTVIRVHPQTGAYGAYGGDAAALQAQNQVALSQQQLQNERNTSDLRLQYERALWQEKLKESQLQSAVQYGGAQQASPYGAYGGIAGAIPVASLMGAGMGAGLMGGQPIYQGGMLPLGSGGGQTNVTNQSATGAANQTVSNTNSYSSAVSTAPQWGAQFGASPWGAPAPYGVSPYGYPQQGGFVSNLLRGLF